MPADYAERTTVKQSSIPRPVPGPRPRAGWAGKLAICLGLVALLSGCGFSQLTSGLGSGLWGGKAKPNPSVAPAVTEAGLLDAAKAGEAAGVEAAIGHGCPKFVIWPRDRTITRYEEGRVGDGLAIIHRGELTRTARECRIEPGRVTVKYGFSGRVLLGPKGRPGAIRLPVVVYVTDRDREKVRTERVFVTVSLTRDNPIGYFSAVRTVTFDIPVGTRPADYKLFVAFDRQANVPRRHGARRPGAR